MRLSPEHVAIPIRREKLTSTDRVKFYDYMRQVLQRIDDSLSEIRKVVNYNQTYIVPRSLDQNSKPDPKTGEAMLWKDADAASGDPSHYLVCKDADGVVVTFASEETV